MEQEKIFFFEILIAEKLKLMLHFSAIEMVLLIFLISQPIIYKSKIRYIEMHYFSTSSPLIYMYVWLNILGGFILQKTNFLSKKLQVNESIFVLRHKIKRILVFHKKEMNHVSMYTTNSFSFCSLRFLPPFKNKCTTSVSQLH